MKNAIYNLPQLRIEPRSSNMPDVRSTTALCHLACSVMQYKFVLYLRLLLQKIFAPAFNTYWYGGKLELDPRKASVLL